MGGGFVGMKNLGVVNKTKPFECIGEKVEHLSLRFVRPITSEFSPTLPTLEFLSVAVIKVWSIFSYVIVSNNDVEKAKRGFPWHPWHMLTLISCQVFRSGREGKCLESIIFK